MANAKISNDAVFVPETSDVRNITGLAGINSSGNTKITGSFLAQSVVNESGSGIGTNDGSGNINSRVAFYGVGNPSNTLAGAEGFQYYSANITNSIPASLQLGVPGGSQYDVGNLILSGNYKGSGQGNTSPKIEFRSNHVGDPNDYKSFILTTTTQATDDQLWQLPKKLPSVGEVLRAATVSNNDVLLEWHTPTDGDTTYTFDAAQSTAGSDNDPFLTLTGTDASVDNVKLVGGTSIGVSRNTAGDEVTIAYTGSDDNTTYDLNTSASGVLGQIDLVGSDGTTDVVQLEGSGTVSVSSNASGLITITGAGGSGGIDFSNIIITGTGNIKADLTQSSQTQYGQAITVKANGAISNGDVVVSDYSTGEVRGLKPTTLPTQNTITGVAIEDIADGQSGKVLVYGYATVNYNSIAPTSTATNLELDAVSNGNTLVLTPGVIQPFSDSGGIGSNYSSNNTYTHIFDAGAGERVQLTINSFEFEGTGSTAFDRLGFQESADDVTYSNVAFTPGLTSSTDYSSGWRRMDTDPGWQSGGGLNNDVTQGPYADGYVLPGDNATGAFTLPLTVTTTQRYLKVFFYSDGSSTGDGWDIDIETTGTVPNTNTGLGSFVYLDATDVARGTNQIGTGRLLGIATGGTVSNNSTVIFVEPPRVT